MTVETRFLNKSVDYCEEYNIKKSLCKYIEAYNKYLYNYKTKINLNDNKDCEVSIPNNNKKFYLYIIKKNDNMKSCYTLYFFPDKNSKLYFNNFLLIKNTIDDFFIECDIKLDNSFYLLEGYLYGNAVKKHFLITDILFKDHQLIDCNYSSRLNMINELFFDKMPNLSNINNLLSIGVHNCINNYLIKVFLNNFIWKHELICIETVRNFEKQMQYLPDCDSPSSKGDNTLQEPNYCVKKICKSKVSDIYNVYNLETNDSEGLLYINTLKMSRHLLSLFKEHTELTLKCTFNTNFQKWQIVM